MAVAMSVLAKTVSPHVEAATCVCGVIVAKYLLPRIDAVGVNCECRQSAIELPWAVQVCVLIVPTFGSPNGASVSSGEVPDGEMAMMSE